MAAASGMNMEEEIQEPLTIADVQAQAEKAFDRPLRAAGGRTENAGENWFEIYKIRDNVFALYEPHYFQRNYSYLVVGREQALLIDAGAQGGKNINGLVRSLTDRPCAVLPTHLHYDHLGGLAEFEKIWLADTPSVREARQSDGRYLLPQTSTLDAEEGLNPEPLKVDRLISPDETIDLGGVRLKALSAPGHSRDDIVLFDPAANILFVGDYIYPGPLISGNDRAYAATTARLLDVINDRTLLLSAHANSRRNAAPVMGRSDLEALRRFLDELATGKLESKKISDAAYKIASADRYIINKKISLLNELVWSDGTKYEF